MCFLIILMPSTMTRCFFGDKNKTLPRLLRSVPATTTTSSPFFTCLLGITSNNFRGQGTDLHKLAISQFPGDRAENSGSPRSIVFCDNHHRVAGEPEKGSIASADRFAGPRHHAIHH